MAASLTNEQNALAQVMRADDEEAHRAFWWRLLPAVERMRALSLARMDRRRAEHDLATFTIQERAMIHAALSNHIARMTLLMNCTGIATERRQAVDLDGARYRQVELEQKQEGDARRRQEFARLQEQEQEQARKGRLH